MMRFMLILCVCLLSATGLSAQLLPALHRVVGVASDDVLNVRSEPSAQGQLIGHLAHDAAGVEVISYSDDGRWAYIAWEERGGWASMRYLQVQEPQYVADSIIPQNMQCFGAEPFWSLTFQESGAMVLNSLDREQSVQDRVGWSGTPLGRIDTDIAFESSDRRLTGVLSRQSCWDGMSDRPFGWRLNLIEYGLPGNTFYTGCCTQGL